jgi:FkbM family methyltransferase
LVGASDERLNRVTRRAAKLEDALAKQRARAETERSGWQAQQAKWEPELRDLREQSAFYSRRVLDPDVLHGLLPHRARTLSARAAHSHADRYDAQMQQASPAYREALTSVGDPHAELVTTEVQGLRWTVPVPPTLTGERRDRFIAKQRFPYRSLTQTREFAVGPVLLDLGANVGRMAIPRVILGDFERAYCAEPDPLNFAALVRNVAANGLRGLVLADQVAIGSTTEPVRLHQAKYPTGHSLAAGAVGDDATIEVPCWTLDAWCQRLSIDPALVTYVKVDTQGWEAHVLRGASSLLQHPHIAWQLEVQPDLLDAAGTPSREFFELCAEHFTHFVDLDKVAKGPRARRTFELPQALEYLIGRKAPTDIVLFNASGRLDRSREDREAI